MSSFVEKSLPTILTIIGCVGVGVTSVLAARGHQSALKKLENSEIPDDVDTREAFIEAAKITWKDYAPAVISGGVTVGCIIGSNGLHLKEEAALAALVGIFGTRLKNMDKEILRKYGKDALDEMRNDILNNEVNERSDNLKELAKKKPKEETATIYYEPFTEQFFWATEEQVKDAELHLNQEFQRGGYLTLGDFIEMLPKKANLSTPDWSREIGWFSGDETFEWNAAFTSGYISLNPTKANVDGTSATVIQYSIYPAEPGPDYWDIIKGNKMPYTYYRPEPGDQIEMDSVLGLPMAG